MRQCTRSGCDRPATVAIRSRDAGLRGLTTTVYYDPEGAPKGSELNCGTHGAQLLTSLLTTLAGAS